MGVAKHRWTLRGTLCACLLRGLVACLGFFSAQALADSAPAEFRIGHFIQPGLFAMGENGRPRGANVEVENYLANELNCRFVEVPGSFVQSLSRLESGEVDLVCGVMRTSERNERFLYPHVPTGFFRGYLYVREDAPYESGKPATWTNLVVGTVSNSLLLAKLDDMLRQRRVTYDLRFYDDEAAMIQGLVSGEVSAIVTLWHQGMRRERILLALPGEPTYVAVSRRRPELRAEIDRALAKWLGERPGFVEEIAARHFPVVAQPCLDLTADEQDYLRQRIREGRPVRVDIYPVMSGVKTLNPKTGEVEGYLGNILDEIAQLTGLTFEGMGVSEDEAQAISRFERGDSELWASYGTVSKKSWHGRGRIESFHIPQVLVRRAGSPYRDFFEGRLATYSASTNRLAIYRERAKGLELVLCEDAEDALKAVLDGRADNFACSYATAIMTISDLGWENRFELLPFSNGIYRPNCTCEISGRVDPRLHSILQKAARALTREHLTNLFYAGVNAAIPAPLVTPMQLMALILGLVSLALLIVLVVVQRARHRIHGALEAMRGALAQARQAARVKSDFLATMSHEIRTPLNAVIGFSEFLAQPAIPEAKRVEYAHGVSRSAHALLALINDVLDLSKLEAGKMVMFEGVCNLRSISDEMEGLFRAETERTGVTLVHHVPRDLPVLRLTEARFRQILLNLEGNAVKFTPPGGRIDVRFAFRSIAPDHVEVTLVVEDTGCGITPEKLRTVFDPFVQDGAVRGGKVYEGTGLGLPIVKRLTEAAGGSVEVDSLVGKGTKFTLTFADLEVSASVARQENAPEMEKVVADGSKMRILLVDDVPMNLKILSHHVMRLGAAQVETCASGEEALAKLKAESFDMVMTDLWMPNMNGVELAGRIRALGLRMPIVAVTADTEAVARFPQNLFADSLVKPLTTERVAALFARLSSQKECDNA
ncbi:MAG: ATP-binding protein [bacterium]|nr:ATP-binding protein [bacterium]